MRKQKKVVTCIDLFAGLGGIRLGFVEGMKKNGIDVNCVFTSELKPYAIKAYQGYFGNEEIHGDITKVKTEDIPDFDYLLGGFPCQPFSSAGKRMGFTDTRGTLFFEIERILKEKMDSGHPAEGFLLENVEGLVNHDGGRTLKVIIEHLEALGYKVSYKVLDSQYFGLAQSRKRIYIVGVLHSDPVSLDEFPITTAVLADIIEHNLPVIKDDFTDKLLSKYSIDELPGKSIKDKRGGDDNIHSWDLEIKGRTTKEERKLLNAILKERRKKKWAAEIGIKWMDGMPLTESQISTFYKSPNLHKMLEDLVSKGYIVYEYPKELINGRRVPDSTKPKGYNIVAGKLSFEFSKILDPATLAPTLVAMDVEKLGIIDNRGIRRLSVREGQRLCGYPQNYSLDTINTTDAFDLLGNTVCVPVIEAISERIGEAWKKTKSS